MRTYRGIVRDESVILPEGAPLREGSTVEIIVTEAGVDHDADEAMREALVQRDLRATGLLLEPPPAGQRRPRERRLIEVKGLPLSQVVIDERG